MKMLMAMITCPECGKELSDKAKKCVYCGKVMIEEPQKFCGECGKEIPFDVQECPYCGCPIKAENPENVTIPKISEKTNKKPIIAIVAIALVIIMISLVVKFTGPILNKDEQLAYQNAVQMKNMLSNPDSFRLYDEMFLLKHFDDSGALEYTYTVFKYGGANAYGAIIADEAIFKDRTYIMNYSDDPDVDAPNYIEQLLTSMDVLAWKIKLPENPDISESSDNTKQMVEVKIDVEKIKDKMGLK